MQSSYVCWVLIETTGCLFFGACSSVILINKLLDQANDGPQLRKSCDYCVRMKRGCDGNTPCELCMRRNKDCVHSVKKRSGPAKVYWLLRKENKGTQKKKTVAVFSRLVVSTALLQPTRAHVQEVPTGTALEKNTSAIIWSSCC